MSAPANLQATALVHEAYLRLIDLASVRVQDRAHFFRPFGADDARIWWIVHGAPSHRQAGRRGPGLVQLDEIPEGGVMPVPPSELMALDDALSRLPKMASKKRGSSSCDSLAVERRRNGGSAEDLAAHMRD